MHQNRILAGVEPQVCCPIKHETSMSKRKIKVSFILETDSTEHLSERLQAAFGDGVVMSNLWLQEMSEIQSDLEIQQYDYRDYQVTIGSMPKLSILPIRHILQGLRTVRKDRANGLMMIPMIPRH